MYPTIKQRFILIHCSLSGGCKVRERLEVSKQAAQKFDVERFNLRKPNKLEVRKQYQIKISNRLAALEKRDSKDIHRAWQNMKENIKTSSKQSKSVRI